jgi:nucleoside-diphosphate-sugar epimerase
MILVTGASGFVGSALAQMLHARGIPHRLASRRGGAGHVAVATLDQDTNWMPALDGVDTVVHLAARVHVMDETEQDPLAAFRQSNVAASVNLARQAVKAGVRRLVFVSSIKVNGESTESGRPFSEGDLPQPVGDYGISKFEAEQALLAIGSETGLEVSIVRPPLVYGPGVKANFHAMIRAVQKRLPLPLASIANKRSLIFVENLADLLIVCAQHRNAANAVFMASDGQDLSTPEMIAMLAGSMGHKPFLLPVPVPVLRGIAKATGRSETIQRLTENLQVDIALSRTRLGWTPPVELEEAFARTVRASLH